MPKHISNVIVPSPATLALEALAAGSVLFVGTGGVVAENNTNLIWDNITKRLGVGTNVGADTSLEVSNAGNTTSAPAITLSNATDTNTLDPAIFFRTGTGLTTRFVIGVDDSDSDKFKIHSSNSFSVGSDFEIDTFGNITINNALTLLTQATTTSHAVKASRTITAGTGLSGGGDLTADRTISIAPKTVRVPINLTTPRTASLGGNCFWSPRALGVMELGVWEVVKDGEGVLYGSVAIPKNLAPTPNAKFILLIGANATSGVTRMRVDTASVGDGEPMNPGSMTTEGPIDVTVPGTAYLRKDVTIPASGNIAETLTADDQLLIAIDHEGGHTNDTLNANTLLFDAFLQVDVL